MLSECFKNRRFSLHLLFSAKSNIKSRLGLKAVEEVAKQAEEEFKETRAQRARSVKERLGLRSDSPVDSVNKPLRSGIIRLNRGRGNTVKGEVRVTRNLEGVRNYKERDNVPLLPRITIHNKMEERKTSIKERLGLLDLENEEGRKNRKWKEIDEELSNLLQEEDVDIEESELELLTKKEKKKLLKKLLTSQGREDDYDYIVRKKKKRVKRKEKDFDEDSVEEDRGRRINVKSRSGPSPNPEDWKSDEADDDALKSEEEIELTEELGGIGKLFLLSLFDRSGGILMGECNTILSAYIKYRHLG